MALTTTPGDPLADSYATLLEADVSDGRLKIRFTRGNPRAEAWIKARLEESGSWLNEEGGGG